MSRAGASSTELSALRALTYRLSATSASQLPQQAPAIAASLANCKTLFASTPASGSKPSSEASVAIHKYRTLLSTLLQDRAVQARWTAIVLTKATVEVGGWETLQKSLPWVRGLLGILARPDPPSSKKLCLIALTRIFALTREYPMLVREITTPSLPTYIQSCLQIASSKCPASLLQAVLESFIQLLPRHPTIFRSYTKQLHQLLGRVIAPTPSSKLGREQLHGPDLDTSSETSGAARRLYVQLPCCAPKGASNEEWERAMKEAVACAHRVADKVFRAVVEDWQSSQDTSSTSNDPMLDGEVQALGRDSMNLAPWSGIYAGGERLVGILQLVKEYLANSTSGTVSLQVGLILDLTTRMLSLTVPSSASSIDFFGTMRFNNQVGKEERENLWMILPHIHVASIEILCAMIDRCEDNTSPLDAVLLDQLMWVFVSEKDNGHIRSACYATVARLLTRSGLALPKSSIDPIGSLIRACCDDMLPVGMASVSTKSTSTQNNANGVNQQVSTNADAFLNSGPTVGDGGNYNDLQLATRDLLPVLLSNIRPQHLSDSLRARIDRTAILTRHKHAMIASVLSPPPSRKFGKPAPSIMPLLARAFPGEKEVESLLKPRMPVLRTSIQERDGVEDMEDGAEEGAAGDNSVQDGNHFAGKELDTLLEPATHAYQNGDDPMPNVLGDRDAQGHSHPRIASPPIANGAEADVNSQEPGQSPSGMKRSQQDYSPLSQAKRVKAATSGEAQPVKPATIPTPVALNPYGRPEAPVGSPVPLLTIQKPQQPARAVPTAPEATSRTGDDSDDNDDFGELVLGQDTDEESDS